jgi:hypothetical protein
MLGAAMKNAIVMTLIIIISHLLLRNLLEDAPHAPAPERHTPQRHVSAKATLAARKHAELLKFVMQDEDQHQQTQDVTRPAQSQPITEVAPSVTSPAFSSVFSVVDFQS